MSELLSLLFRNKLLHPSRDKEFVFPNNFSSSKFFTVSPCTNVEPKVLRTGYYQTVERIFLSEKLLGIVRTDRE